jgi:hypothetical protein
MDVPEVSPGNIDENRARGYNTSNTPSGAFSALQRAAHGAARCFFLKKQFLRDDSRVYTQERWT